QRWLTLTRSPAHYGFHATLKAPFELQEDYTVQSLAEHLQQFACHQSRIELHGLAPRQMAGFSALTLDGQTAQLHSLAMQIVTEFEPYRRALTEADIERRMAQALSTRQLELLRCYGYPYVDDEFRFHMTLSGPIGEQDTDYLDWLQGLYREIVTDPPLLDQIAIFTQTDRQAAFVRQFTCPIPA
ncbi:MAG: DUF1045 domain-containing protein, partial [Granulosicoccus sp.]|nr:DUF1045 domain-containing protein [Granulosicoccus sp.]